MKKLLQLPVLPALMNSFFGFHMHTIHALVNAEHNSPAVNANASQLLGRF